MGIPRGRDARIVGRPDPGVLRMKELCIGGKRVTWANLFAVNDRESMVAAMENWRRTSPTTRSTVGILNNRADRERRGCSSPTSPPRPVVRPAGDFGAHEGLVTDRLAQNGVTPTRSEPRRRTEPAVGPAPRSDDRASSR